MYLHLSAGNGFVAMGGCKMSCCVCVGGGGEGVVLGIGNWSWREIEVLFYVGVSCVWLLFVFVDC